MSIVTEFFKELLNPLINLVLGMDLLLLFITSFIDQSSGNISTLSYIALSNEHISLC